MTTDQFAKPMMKPQTAKDHLKLAVSNLKIAAIGLLSFFIISVILLPFITLALRFIVYEGQFFWHYTW